MGVVVRQGMLYADFRDSSNKRVRKALELKNSKANRAKAEKVLLPKLVNEYANKHYFSSRKMPTFGEQLKLSLMLHKQERGTQTNTDYSGIAEKYLFPRFGERKIDSIKPSEIMVLQNELKEKALSSSRINKIRIVLSTTFKDAMMDEIIDKNPLTLVKTLPKDRPKEESRNPFTLEEIKELLHRSTGYLQVYIAIAFFTGMRSSEIIGLRWSDICLEDESISIMRGMVKGELTPTKNAASQRIIELPRRLKPYLKDQFDRTGQFQGYIFLSQENKPFHDIKAIRETTWKKLFKTVSVPYRNIYTLRHTFTSHMISHGEDITWVSRNLGHSSVQTTLNHYNKLIKPKHKIDRAAFLDEIL